jgi:hypothetical protein
LTGDLYDHLIAVIVISVLFVAAVVAVPNISYVNLLHMDQQQLRNIALATLKTMLLDVGYPTNWGSSVEFNASAVERFGLALAEESSLYILDPDKVQRLVVDNPLNYLSYEQVRELLGLQNYGFSLEIRPPFNVEVQNQSLEDDGIEVLRYEITVTTFDEKPIPNAVVEAFIFTSIYRGGEGEGEKYSIGFTKKTLYTNEMGKASLNEVLTGSISDVIVVFRTTVSDVHSMIAVYRNGAPPNDVAEVNMVNDTIVLTPPDVTPKDARWVLNVFAVSSDGVTSIYNGTKEDKINWGEGYNRWEKSFNSLKETDPILLVFNFKAVEKGSGRKGVLVVGPYPNYLGSRVINYSGEGKSLRDVGVQLQRVVSISGMTYVVELALWEENNSV